MNMFKKKTWLAGFAVVAIAISYLYAATYQQRFVLRGTEVWRVDDDGSLENNSSITTVGPIKYGNSETGSSTTLPTNSTASQFSNWVPVYNPTGSSIPVGTVLIASNTGIGYVNSAAATIDITGIVGIAAEAISATSNGWMIPRGGGYAVALTTGTIAIGDVLVTSGTVAGRLGVDNTPTTGADVAIAMEAGDAAGDSIVVIMR